MAENPKSHRNLNQEGFKMGHPTINPQIIVILTLKANIYRVLDKYTWYSESQKSQNLKLETGASFVSVFKFMVLEINPKKLDNQIKVLPVLNIA